MSAANRPGPERDHLDPEALYHLVTAEEWEGYAGAGTIRPESLATEGFVHCSWGRQVEATAGRHFPDVSVLALELDVARIHDVELVEEDSYRSGEAFPHLYGPIPVDAVLSWHKVI